MKLFRGLGRTVKRAMGFSSIKNDSQFIMGLGKDIINIANPKHRHDDNALPIKMTESQFQQAINKYSILFRVHLAIFIGICFYAFVKFYHHDYLSGIVSSAIILLELAQMFRCHFLMFRLKTRNFSATVLQWFHFTFGSHKGGGLQK